MGPGERLGGRYRIEERIGSGGMATVWRAEDERAGGRVAVKVISDVLAHDPGYVRRFAREAEIAESLEHPSIVGVLDHDVAAERPYLVMELVEGDTLAATLGAGRSVDAVAVARSLLEALERIHAAGIVHRDVKPGNVLIDPAGAVKLTDFGIARAGDHSRLTMTGNVVGTLTYMAPEVRRGEPADARSDLYSAGAVIAEAGGERRGAALDALVEELTAENPGARPATATEALTLLAPRREATAVTESLPVTGRGSRRLAAVGALAAAAVLVAVIALASGGGPDDGGGRDPSTTSSTATGSSSTTPAETTSEPATTAPAPTAPVTEEPPGETTPPAEPKEPKPTKEPKPPAEEPKPPKDEKPPPGLEKKDEKAPPGQAKK